MPHFELFNLVKWLHFLAMTVGGGGMVVALLISGMEESQEDYRGLAFPPAADQQIQLAVQWGTPKRPQSAASLSDGTLRFLCLLAVLAQPNPPGLIAFDEPETGLHPRMMRIVAELAENAALHTQVIFTTHSAAFLDGFSKETPPTTTVVALADGRAR